MHQTTLLQDAQALVNNQSRQKIPCPVCPTMEYIDGSPIITMVTTYEELARHLIGHNQPHIQGESLEYFTYNLFKQTGRISKYTRWLDWDFNLFIQIDWNKEHYIYIMWLEAIRNTCKNNPCFECWLKRINKEKSHDIMKAEFKKHGFILTKTGRKKPLTRKELEAIGNAQV